jgi:hypothetical protein
MEIDMKLDKDYAVRAAEAMTGEAFIRTACTDAALSIAARLGFAEARSQMLILERENDQLLEVLGKIAVINKMRDRYSSEIDTLIIDALKETPCPTT